MGYFENLYEDRFESRIVVNQTRLFYNTICIEGHWLVTKGLCFS